MKYVLQDMKKTERMERVVFVCNANENGTTRSGDRATRYERAQAIDIQYRSRGRYRALPEIAPIVEDNS